jgi:redox-sensitive bicupin YhaK (pirin superfamily)
MKKLLRLHRDVASHWVGDGFPVRNLFSYDTLAREVSPFLLLDYAGPRHFPPAEEPRGVGFHPHRGFETVTIVYEGELQHRDTAGNAGRIGAGDVQWMTAARGVLHEEKHSPEFTRRGGTLHMVQLWVNLPARVKMAPARYQTLLDAQIPAVDLEGAGRVRVIAGELRGSSGPARTFTPIDVWDVRLRSGARAVLPARDGHTTALAVLGGSVRLNGAEDAGEPDVAVFERAGQGIDVDARSDALLLLLGGEPIDEPIAAQGPFVMNTPAEIRQAYRDFAAGRMGRLDV